MFTPIPGGTSQEIQGLLCHLPPVGHVYDPLFNNGEGGWVKTGVYRRHKTKAECYWEPDPRWKKIDKWRQEEENRQKTDPGFIHAELQDFKAEAWRNRLGGFWFSNNGQHTYITGLHWYYLSCYKMDVGLPNFRDPDREFFYAWQYVTEDPECFGLAYITKRRRGKTYVSGCIGLESASRSKNFRVGIQSKTDDDAKEVYIKAIVEPYRKLPFFFRPNTDLPPSGKSPAAMLKFYSGKVATDEDELESTIGYKPSNVVAYDGYKMHYYIADETGKTVLVSVAERWSVAKWCLLDDEGVIQGKALFTTTVEEMEKGGAPMLEIWKDSNQMEKGDRRRTPSGLYKFFLPSDKTRHTDKYGIPDTRRAKADILEERAMLGDNDRAVAAATRKEPLDEREAFMVDASECVFNPKKLHDRSEDLKWIPPAYITGNFMWKDGLKDTEVEFIPNPNGRFKMMYNPPEELRNRKFARGGHWYPETNNMFSAGGDTYDHRHTTDSSKKRGLSNGSIVIMKDESLMYASDIDEGPALLYINRPATPEAFYEDCLMAVVYYGCDILLENNKSKILDYFADRSYGGYLYWMEGKTTPGVAAGSRSNDEIAEVTGHFIEYHMGTVWFIDLIDNWIKFDPANTTVFDAAMAFGYARIRQLIRRRGAKRKKTTMDVREVFSFWGPKRK